MSRASDHFPAARPPRQPPWDHRCVVLAATARLLGLFADEGMLRPFSPSLASMTQTAIDILSRDPEGFFLMVEGGQIDWAGHANDGANIIGDAIDFDSAVAVGIWRG